MINVIERIVLYLIFFIVKGKNLRSQSLSMKYCTKEFMTNSAFERELS